MLSCQNFRHIPNIHTRVPTDDPLIQSHPNNVKARRNWWWLVPPCQAAPVCSVQLSDLHPSAWSSKLMMETHRKSQSRIRGGGFNQLLEHQNKPSPSSRSLPFECFEYSIFILSIFKSNLPAGYKLKILFPNLFVTWGLRWGAGENVRLCFVLGLLMVWFLRNDSLTEEREWPTEV